MHPTPARRVEWRPRIEGRMTGRAAARALRGLVAALAALVALACAAQRRAPVATGFESGHGVTLVNLHPDNERSRLYAVNYQQAGLIPVCSEIEYRGLDGDTFRFRVVATDRVYEYLYHDAAAEPFVDHLHRFFGESCPS